MIKHFNDNIYCISTSVTIAVLIITSSFCLLLFVRSRYHAWIRKKTTYIHSGLKISVEQLLFVSRSNGIEPE